MGILGDLYVTTDSTNCDELDMGAVGYKGGKWGHLIRSYLGPEKVEELKEFGVNSTALSLAFDFRRKDEGNGSCLRELILTREKRSLPWQKATVIWRSVELQQKWLPDLILIHKILELIPNTEMEEIAMFFTQAHQNVLWIGPLLKPIFNVDPKELDLNTPHSRSIRKRFENSYAPGNNSHRKYAKLRKLKELHQLYESGQKPDSIKVEDLDLGGHYDGK